MPFNPLDLVKFASLLRYIPDIIKAIQAVETLFKKPSSDMTQDAWNLARQDAAIAMMLQFLGIAEGVAGRDILSDVKVAALMRRLIDILIALDHAIRDFKALKSPSVDPIV